MTGLAKELGVKRLPVPRFVLKGIGSRPAAWVMARTLRHVDFFVLRVSGGRFTVTDGGLPTLFLTTTGARSGQSRVSQLIAIPVGEELGIIGSNFGQDHHPGWVHNVLAHPSASVRFRRNEVPVVVKEVTGTEAERVWNAGIAVYPGFGTYRTSTDRHIKVFLLERTP